MRTLLERMRDWRWWGEQIAHHLIGAIIVGVVCGIGFWLLLRAP